MSTAGAPAHRRRPPRHTADTCATPTMTATNHADRGTDRGGTDTTDRPLLVAEQHSADSTWVYLTERGDNSGTRWMAVDTTGPNWVEAER